MTPAQNNIKNYYDDPKIDSSYQHWAEKDVGYEMHYGFRKNPNESHVNSLEAMNEYMANLAKIKDTSYVLDAGCGVGASCIWLTKKFRAKTHGISLSELQINKAQQLSIEIGLKDCTCFSKQDFCATNFHDSTFDVVWGIESICYAENKRKFLREAHRILKPNGRIVIADYYVVKTEFTSGEDYAIQRWSHGWKIPNIARHDVFLEDIRATEYHDVRVLDITPNIVESSKEIYKRGMDGFPNDIFRGKNKLQMEHVEACIFQKICLDLGLWRYLIISAIK